MVKLNIYEWAKKEWSEHREIIIDMANSKNLEESFAAKRIIALAHDGVLAPWENMEQQRNE